jgi:hypothetical protein
MSSVLICSICHQPVAVENSKTDENRHASHEDCYLQRLLASLDHPSGPQHAEQSGAHSEDTTRNL